MESLVETGKQNINSSVVAAVSSARTGVKTAGTF
jgi:hypothetical protein